MPDPDTLISFSAAARRVSEALGVPISDSTIRAWSRNGLHGELLPVRRLGGRVFTTLRAVEDFLARVDAAGAAAPGGRRKVQAAAAGAVPAAGTAPLISTQEDLA